MAGPDESNTESHNGGLEQLPMTPSSKKSTTPSTPVKIKVEVIADDEEEEVVIQKNPQRDTCHTKSKAISTSSDEQKSTIRKRVKDDDEVGGGGGAGGGDGERVGSRRRSVDHYADEMKVFSGAGENEDAGSDDLNHDRYSPLMCENSDNDDFSPIQDQNGNVVLEVDCGSNSALLYVNKLCQGSKGQCILFEDRWHTPNEFQFISGRETAKDWKRSIRHRGKSLKILMGRGLLRAHPLMCECDTCRLNFATKGLRIGDRRGGTVSSSSTTSNGGSMAMVDRSRHRRTAGPDGEGGHLNDIIDQLQHGNNNGYSNGNHDHHAYDSGRKRSLGVDNVSPTGSSPSSMSCGLALVKRPRSVSPRDDDIYDEQQRKIFEAANSPEPQNIENLRRSLNLGSSRSNSPSSGDRSSPSTGSHHSFYGSHSNGRHAPTVMVAASVNSNLVANGTGPADLSRHSSTSPTRGSSATPTGMLISQVPQMIVKHQAKSRKQTAPQHLDVGNHGDENHAHRAAHIVLSNYSGQQYKANAAVRPRYQSTPVYNHRSSTNSSTNHHATGSSGELNLSTNGGSRRTHSAMTPTTRSPSQRAPGTPVKMIELTRPEIVPSSSRPSSTHSSSTPGEEGRSHTPVHTSIGNTDAVFLPSDMTSWSISDVTHFVQSLKGCEDYSQVFRDQAIDGEILPVLTEDHLLHNMGLKLGPALKIRLHVARRLGFTLDGQYCNTIIPPSTAPPHAPQLPPPPPPPPQQSSAPSTSQESMDTAAAPSGVSTPGPASQKPSGEVFTDDV